MSMEVVCSSGVGRFADVDDKKKRPSGAQMDLTYRRYTASLAID
jgi:hypothetical protein